jgi:PelA/Pel-15E family pectate lyase
MALRHFAGIAALIASIACAYVGTGQTVAPSGAEPLLSEQRIKALARDPNAWLQYVARSRAQRTRDSVVMNVELRALARDTMSRAPYSHGFEITREMTPSWLGSDSARNIAANILSFQTPNGGWSKHVDYSHPRERGQSWFSESNAWQWIATIDNSSTTEQMQFLVMVDSAQPNTAYRNAWSRGFRYLLAAQFPNGCWPQVWPLNGGYHDAATFNDDAITNVLATLQQAAHGKPAFLSDAERKTASEAADRGIECVLDAQFHVNGKPTVWGQQHDPLTLQPTNARSYELTSLTSQESANLLRFLIKQKNPSSRVIASIDGAAAWLEAHKLYGYTYDFATGRHEVAGAGPIWSRMYEIDTGKPIFSDRNGIKLYDWNELKDRRLGYGWYTYAPVLALKQYESWKRKNAPRMTGQNR